MFSKTIIKLKFLLLFCALFSVAYSQTTTLKPFPIPSLEAQECIQELTLSGVISLCSNQSIELWNPQKSGKTPETIQQFCCQTFGEIDCILNATQNGIGCQKTRPAMVRHQQTLLTWWETGDCINVKYNNGQCGLAQINGNLISH